MIKAGIIGIGSMGRGHLNNYIKFMAEKKNALENAGQGKVIFSYEESYGYMIGDYARA